MFHIEQRKCPAGICKELTTFIIDAEKCIACGRCIKVCPTDAIVGEKKVPHVINQEKCIKCGACKQESLVDAVLNE